MTADHDILKGTRTLAPFDGPSGVGAAGPDGVGLELGVHPDSVAVAEVVPSLTTILQSAGAVKLLCSIRKFPDASDVPEAWSPFTVTLVFGVAP